MRDRYSLTRVIVLNRADDVSAEQRNGASYAGDSPALANVQVVQAATALATPQLTGPQAIDKFTVSEAEKSH